MRDAGRHLAERGEALGAPGAVFEHAQPGLVGDDQGAPDRPVAAAQLGDPQDQLPAFRPPPAFQHRQAFGRQQGAYRGEGLGAQRRHRRRSRQRGAAQAEEAGRLGVGVGDAP